MSKSIYVGNLPWSATEEQIQDLFASYGTVHSVKLITDRETGRARGFGFVAFGLFWLARRTIREEMVS